jgi:hypothetical protein
MACYALRAWCSNRHIRLCNSFRTFTQNKAVYNVNEDNPIPRINKKKHIIYNVS